MKDVEEPNEESCEQLPRCSRKEEGWNKKKNGGNEKELQTRGMKRKGIEDKGPPQKKQRSNGKMASQVVTELETTRSWSSGYSPLSPSKQEIDSPSNLSTQAHD